MTTPSIPRASIARSASRLSLVALAAAALSLALAGCGSVPANNPKLEQARSDYRAGQTDPASRELAAVEWRQAGDALGKADAAIVRGDDVAQTDHLVYLAGQRVAIARETVRQKSAEQTVAKAGGTGDKLRLAARTQEADSAQLDAAAAKRQAEMSQRQADVSQIQTADAQARTRALEAQLKDLNARKTDRGLVVTIGDVLFDTDRAQLKSGTTHNVDKLVVFLKAHPERKALVEGYTDSTGSDEHNQGLSARRAEAVRAALVDQGIGAERITSRGYGEAYPVGDNDSAGGRQMNRRVEIVLSDENGAVTPR